MRKLLLLVLIASFSTFANEAPILTNMVRIDIKNDTELKKVLNETLDEDTASDFFDKIQNSKLSVALSNDYNFSDGNDPDPNVPADDLGRTHGLEISFVKNIAPIINKDEYYISITYSTELYSNSTEPAAFQNDYRDVLYQNEEGVYVADQWFKEENFFKAVLGKFESKDAYYWKAGVGFHEINAEENDRGVLLSAIGQQRFHHELLNRNENRYRVYNNIAQDNVSEMGAMIEGEVGRDFTFSESDVRRTWLRVGSKSRLTSVDDASYIGLYGQIGHDYVNSKKVGFRLQTGLTADLYADGSAYSDSYIGLGIHIKPLKMAVSLKYIVPFTKDPGYLNALPQDFTNRDANAAPGEPIFQFNVDGRF